MRILFDHGTPAPLRHHLPGHYIDTAARMGWETLSNGDLLNTAEESGYDALITTDQNIRHQQNIQGRSIRTITLMSGRWPDMRQQTHLVGEALERAGPGTITEVHFRPNID